MQPQQHMYLLVDAGNTHVHLNLGNAGRMHLPVPLKINLDELSSETANQSVVKIVDKFKEHSKKGNTEFAVVASVIPSMNKLIENWIIKNFGIPSHFISYLSPGMVDLDYPKPETIGIDRLANAVACAKKGNLPSVVVDFGTATTFDVINKNGAYCGGIIAPGISLMTDYLHEKTELLPKITLNNPKSNIGKSTTEAMQIGAIDGYKGLIKQILEGIGAELQSDVLDVIFTGGCTEIIRIRNEDLNSKISFTIRSHVNENITMEGLGILAPQIQDIS